MSQSVSYFLMSLAVLENPRKNLRRLEANERRSSFFFLRSSSEFTRVPGRPAVVSCATSCSGVLVRNVFPVPFELKFCQFDFDYCRFERQFLISETTCLMMISFEGDVKREFEV